MDTSSLTCSINLSLTKGYKARCYYLESLITKLPLIRSEKKGPGVVAHAFDSSIWRQRHGSLSDWDPHSLHTEIQSNQIYRGRPCLNKTDRQTNHPTIQSTNQLNKQKNEDVREVSNTSHIINTHLRGAWGDSLASRGCPRTWVQAPGCPRRNSTWWSILQPQHGGGASGQTLGASQLVGLAKSVSSRSSERPWLKKVRGRAWMVGGFHM